MINSEPKIITLSDTEIPIQAVLRRLGYPPEKRNLEGQVEKIFNDALSKARSLMQPMGVFRILKIASRSEDTLQFPGTDFVLKSQKVKQMLRQSDYMACFVATIGDGLEKESITLSENGDITQGVILDAIGSETADEAAQMMHNLITKLAEENGHSTTPRFSPGYGDWPVTIQKELVTLGGGSLIRVSVNASSFMHPGKSVSAVLGLEKK